VVPVTVVRTTAGKKNAPARNSMRNDRYGHWVDGVQIPDGENGGPEAEDAGERGAEHGCQHIFTGGHVAEGAGEFVDGFGTGLFNHQADVGNDQPHRNIHDQERPDDREESFGVRRDSAGGVEANYIGYECEEDDGYVGGHQQFEAQGFERDLLAGIAQRVAEFAWGGDDGGRWNGDHGRGVSKSSGLTCDGSITSPIDSTGIGFSSAS